LGLHLHHPPGNEKKPYALPADPADARSERAGVQGRAAEVGAAGVGAVAFCFGRFRHQTKGTGNNIYNLWTCPRLGLGKNVFILLWG